MVHKKLTGFLLGVLVVSLASLAWAGVPDLDLSSATTGGAGSSVFNLPAGNGYGFDEAKLSDGTVVDATITLTLVDNGNIAIAGYPAEDMWLETSAGSLAACTNGVIADADTDANGMTHWTNPMNAGGYSQNGETVNVYIAGSALNQPGLNIMFNSADNTGDLNVNLADLTNFTTDYTHPPANYRSDLSRDGVINLGDLSLFTRGNGHGCP